MNKINVIQFFFFLQKINNNSKHLKAQPWKPCNDLVPSKFRFVIETWPRPKKKKKKKKKKK